MSDWLELQVSDKFQWTDRHFSLRFRGQQLAFRPGQFVRIGLEIDGEIVARPYSLVNVPGEDELEIFFDIVPGGPLTSRLAALEPGDPVKLAPRANGFLVIEEIPASEQLWMLATGTGIGPFISILHSEQAWQQHRHIVLVYSVRSHEELAYQASIREIETEYADRFSYVPVVTREVVDGAINQRITSALQSGELEERVGRSISAGDSHVMMCGNADMIRQVFALLEQRGMRKHLRREAGHITTEKYH